MKLLCGFGLLALLLVAEGFQLRQCPGLDPEPDWDGDKPWYCGTFPCPFFTTEQRDGYELRSYPGPSRWAVISIKTRSRDSADWGLRELDSRLYSYSLGRNAANETIPLALPRVTQIKVLNSNMLKITRMFYYRVDELPRPLDSGIKLKTRSSKTVYARTFPQEQRATDADYENTLQSLKDSIEDPGSYNEKTSFRVAFQDPRRPGLKQYEVWIDQDED